LQLRVGILAAMQYRKLKADQIFDGEKLLSGKVLVVSNEGEVQEVVPEEEAGDAEIFAGILSPGFINTHCHLELSHMKGRIPEKTGLVDFVFKVVTERHHPDEEIYEAIANAEDEMIANGIVAVGDICNNILTLPQKLKHRLLYNNFIECSGWLPGVAPARYNRAVGIATSFTIHDSRFTTIVPHAPYSVSEDLWHLMMPGFDGKIITIHNQETIDENDFFINGTGDLNRMYAAMKIDNSHHLPSGKTSIQSYYNKLSAAENIILVHNSFTSQQDIDFINLSSQPQTINQKPETFFALCINANQYIENVVPPIELFRKNDCNIVIGTDSLASNHSLSIADEINTIRKFFPSIPPEEILKWATKNGAKALGREDVLGSFENGKRPGVILLSGKEKLEVVKRVV
jgi:aminodeoxyfutalosine deaminase